MSLDKSYMKIFNTFGEKTQIMKLREEVEEFIAAIESGTKKEQTEECADVMNMINQFAYAYKLNKQDTLCIMTEKVYRTLNRIDNGYYEGKDK
ncbi:hypothetical protein JR334_01955 [Clostridia bacterium]|nr:hypothetical protein JR334_01955 [Clostridia bacterium]